MLCPDCNKEIPNNSRYCNYCGSHLVIAKEIDYKRNNALTIAVLFFVADMLLCLLIKFIPALQKLQYYIIFDTVTAAFTITCIAITFDDIKYFLKWNNFSAKKLLVYVVLAVLSSVLVQFLLGLINRSLFDEEYYYYFIFSNTKYPVLFMFLEIALEPAIIEELGYRGLLMSQLNKILDTNQVIFISSFAFALVHLNILSMVWIFPFAIGLAYVREKEKTIWYGAVIHFTFNATACLVELFHLKLFRL